ncbi:trigger factor [Sphingomonas sp. BN140010]|uniref:Trigger factor n=1 Tax=Sphingomonas arvum TaxID=2992113 RepID=A0ABT3JDZ0_9SPHN|nr:trigger factor [Sphingomonas sp. BN140010]MCW3797251.1 trigger factor [Sphingomonas sp. BN140010]
MQSVEIENEGLKRAYKLTIGAGEIDAKVDAEVKRLAPQIRMPGFRPGKVPANLIRKMHGESLQGQALESAVQEGVQQLLQDKGLRPAMQPQVELAEGYAPGADAEVTVSLETLPDVPAPQIEGLKLERLTLEHDEEQVEQQLKQLASGQKSWTDAEEGREAQNGDQVVIDFIGKTDGVAFEGGTGEDMALELGSGALIPGFEEQLVGVKAGDSRTIEVTFPENYPAENLKGKPATFDITVKAVKTAGEVDLNDEFAKSLGLQDLDQLKGLLRDQQTQELNGLTRTHMKRRLLDQLADTHQFEVPPSMVDAEHQNILAQLEHEASHEADPEAARAEIEKEKDDYRRIAERRVRLGLLLSEIGQANGVDVSQQEMQRLILQAAQQYQPAERERFIQFIQQNPMAAAQLRAPLYEDKVVDFLFEKADITDRPATRAEIEADLESEEGHVHGPGCGHDHSHDQASAPKAKKAKKAGIEDAPEAVVSDAVPVDADAAAEAVKPAKKARAAKPAKGAVDAEPATPEPAEPLKDHAPAKPKRTKANPA